MMISDQSKISQKVGARLKDKKGTDFFSSINPRKKLSAEQVKAMLAEYNDRRNSRRTVPEIAEKYGVTEATVYYHARAQVK